MKKCPKCGNPSYDGAPVCGNCGYNFPKQKSVVPRSEDIFKQEPEKEKTSNDEDTITIIKENIVLIGIIIIITLIVIIGIVVVSTGDSGSIQDSNDLNKYDFNGFSFKYPKTWEVINETDIEHVGAKFYQDENNVTIEFYNTTSTSLSIKDVTQDIISYAQNNGAYVEFIETHDNSSSNVILENANGNYTRFVSLLDNNTIYVFKITGVNQSLIESGDINSTIDSVKIS